MDGIYKQFLLALLACVAGFFGAGCAEILPGVLLLPSFCAYFVTLPDAKHLEK
jgi:hypothetical protein